MENIKEYQYAIQLTRWLLIPFGMWPVKGSLIYQRCIRPILVTLCLSILLFLSVPLGLYIIFVVKDLRRRLRLIAAISFTMTNLFKYLIILFKQRQITECLFEIETDWLEVKNGPDKKKMLKNAKTGRILTMICALLMYAGGLPFAIFVPISKGTTIIGNVSYRYLAYPSHFIFFNPYIKPGYDIVFPIQCFCAMVRYTITCGVCSIIIVFVMHACNKVALTSSMLENLDKNFNNKYLGQVITQHLRFLKYAEKLEEIFNEMCFFDILGGTCMICLVGYYFITEYEQREGNITTVANLLLLMFFIFNMFILCYIAEVLANQCEKVGTLAYMTNWYQLSGKEAQYIILLILWKNHTVKLTAGKMVILSLESFTSIMKIAASYLNILRTVVSISN